MKKILKYTKPYIPVIILAIALLYGQANANLALPDYLSRIVNTGIQQGGIESPTPEAIRAQQLDRCLLFMNSSEQNETLDYYRLIDENSSDYTDYLEPYPVLENESVYVLHDLDSAHQAELDTIMAKTLVTVGLIENLQSNASLAGNISFNLGFNMSMVPEGADLFQIIQMYLPQEDRVALVDNITAEFADLGDEFLSQAGVTFVQREYEALGMDTDRIQLMYIIRAGVLMLLLTLASAVCTISVAYIASKTASGMGRNIRRDLFEKVEQFSSAEFDQFSTASLITRTTNDITQIQMVTMLVIRLVFFAPIMGVGGVIRALDRAPTLSWLIAVAVATLILMIMVVFFVAVPKFKLMQKLVDRLNLVTRENLSGLMVIRAFNMQDFEEERFNRVNVDLTAISLFINRVLVILMPVMMLIMNVLIVGIIWEGSHQVAAYNIQVGDMMAFMQYAMQIVMSFLMLTMMFIFLPRASVSINRVEKVLLTKLSITDPDKPAELPEGVKGFVEFRDVSFRYPGAEEDVLHNITFTAQPGQTTAFIGSTGSGKSTLVNLIPRFYDATRGEILLDGVNIRQLRQHDLRDQIGLVPQKSLLFSGTIESNLRYADEDAPEEIINSSIQIAQATQIVQSKPEGLASYIAQAGANVSGGQKQRLSIARALVKRAPVYILDDCFSALDFKTEGALRRAMKSQLEDSAVLVVTQRVSTVMNADQIIVLDEGKVMGKGTHRDLLESCQTYKEIAESQLAAEELA